MVMAGVPLAIAFALLWQAAAIAATANVTIGDNFFNPASSTVRIGDSVHWTWAGAGFASHSTTSDSTMPYVWDSGIKASGDFTKQYTIAGKFTYHCNVHSTMHGSVAVSPKVSPTSGAAGTAFTITYASAAIDGLGFTVVVQKMNPAGSFANFKTKTTGVAVKWDSTGFAAGTYKFRVILKTATKTSQASPAKSVTLS
jgi:plastocyanin